MKTSVRHYFFAFVAACAIVAGIANASLGTNVATPQLAASLERTADTGVSRGDARTNTTMQTSVVPSSNTAEEVEPHGTEQGVATYHAQVTGALGCAHMKAPLGSVMTVRNTETNQSTQCTVTDRGPYVDGRIVDLNAEDFARVAPIDHAVFAAEVSW